MKQQFLWMAALVLCNQAVAQDSTKTNALEEVVVTATRTALKQSQTGKVVTVIDQSMLQRNAGKTIMEILNTQNGLFINGANNTLGSNQDVYFRGASTGNVLIMINGVPVGDASQITNAFDVNNLNTTQIERIEILKGAQSTLWGSDAVAGVINIITKSNSTKTISPTIAASYGSYNTLRLNTGVSGQLKNINYNVNYGYTSSSGFSAAYDSLGNKNFDNDGLKQHNVLIAAGYEITKSLTASYTGTFATYKADIDASAFADDKDFFVENTNYTNSLHFNYKAGKTDLRLLQTFTNSNRLLKDDSADIGGFSNWQRGTYKGNTVITDLYGSIQVIKQFSVIAGLQYLNQNTAQSYESISSFGPFKAIPLNKDSAKANNISVYTSLLLTDVKHFNTELGFRINKHSIYGTNSTFTFNPSYNIDEYTRVFVNISSGYRIPSLYQLYSEYGNKKLKPEKSNSYEIGVQAFSNNKRNNIRLVAFKRDIKNLIAFFTNTNFESQYINRDRQNDFGFEMEATISIGKSGSWASNFTYVNGSGTEDGVKINNLFRRPNFIANSMLTVMPVRGLTLIPSFRFISSRLKGPFDRGPVQMPEYYTIDFYTSYNFAKKFGVFADLRNITNQRYFDIPGYNSRQRNFMVGFNATF
jgi:vitamin B12 transporter